MTALDRLKQLCLATTQPGPWSTMTTDGETTVVDANGFWLAEFGPAPHDAAFVAALSPDVALKLIADLQRLNDEHDELRAIANSAASYLEARADGMQRRYWANDIRHRLAAIDAMRKEVG